MSTFILVMWFGVRSGGPDMLEFDTMEKCEAVKKALLDEYIGELPEEMGWTTNSVDWNAKKRTKCIEVRS